MKRAPWLSSWATWLASWRWPRWIVFCAGLLWLAGYLGAFGTLDESVAALARHPSASEWFTDSMSGRQEAKLVLFLFLVIAPIASLIVAGLVVAVAGLCAIPLGRLIRSERAATVVLLVALAVVFHLQSALWWPPARPVAAIIARAYVISFEGSDGTLHVPVLVPEASH
jgi:hypothetical protein